MPGRTTTKDEPTPPEEVQPTAPEPTPERIPPAPERIPPGTVSGLPPHREVWDGSEWRPHPEDASPLARWERLSVGEAIAEVTRRIGAIEKVGRSTEGYRFRGIDQALAALHPLLGDVGLVILPGQVVREQWETRATAKGGTLNVARLLVRYTFVGPDGSDLTAETWGEGADAGDKATQKAHSQSYKTLVFQTFTIPTEQSAEDEPDATGEPARPFTAEELSRADTAYAAATQADTVEKLAGVRRRALALLNVPVPMVDGSLVPLSVLFDARLAELDRAPGDPS